MARINVEESIYRDDRFANLIVELGDKYRALGALVAAWDLAQRWYLKSPSGYIPQEEWLRFGMSGVIEKVGLARVQDGGIYVSGSHEQFGWLKQRSDAGKTSSTKRLKNPVNDRQRPLDSVERLATSSSSSFSFSEEKKNKEKEEVKKTEISPSGTALTAVPPPALPKASKFSEETRAKMRAFIATYSSAYREKYNAPAEGIRDKGLIGKIGHWIETVSEERAVQLAQVYLQISYKPIDDSCHDLWLFFRHLNRIGNALTTGKDPNQIDWGRVFGGRNDRESFSGTA